MNSRKQGDIGTGYAIAYFLAKGYTVALPISDSQGYDLVIEKDGVFSRVQCKTCFKTTKYGAYRAELRTISNTRGKKFEIRKVSAKNFDFLFVTGGDGKMYLVPASYVDGKGCLTLSMIPQYLVNFGSVGEWIKPGTC